MHPHHLQQAMYAQQQQGANMMFHQFNQLHSMQPAFSSSTLASVTYAQQQMDQQQQQQQQQTYRPEQLLSPTPPQIPTPVQQQQIQQHVQQQLQRSSPINMIQISSPNAWLTGSPIPNQEVFRPIPHAVSRTMLDVGSYNNHSVGICGGVGDNNCSGRYVCCCCCCCC